jgi:phospholipase C
MKNLPVLKHLFLLVAFLFHLLGNTSGALAAAPQPEEGLANVKYIIVIYLENRSFNNLFGMFPGAQGVEQGLAAAPQTDFTGEAYKTLPPVMDTNKKPPVVDLRFPRDLPNRPFLIDEYVPAGEKTGDLVHRFYQQQEQINGGVMDRFAAISDAGGLAMGFYDGRSSNLWDFAKRYTLADNFFHAAFGGSFLNHFWLVCACTPRFENAPSSIVAKLDSSGRRIQDGAVTPDGYAVNTVFPAGGPYPDSVKDKALLLPPQTMPTIGERLTEKGISWVWYGAGWNDAEEGKAGESYQYHHQPFAYFKAYGPGTKARKEHLRDGQEFIDAIASGNLPTVSFYKPIGKFNLHPGYADLTSGDQHIGDVLRAIESSPVWANAVVFVTFDENGGYWDHVPPPLIDRWGPAMRVPTLIISPFAKRGFIDKTYYDTTAILKFIQARFGLKPLGTRDATAADMMNALTFDDN